MSLRDLRWLRVEVEDLDAAAALAGGDLGLMAADRDDRRATFRCDHRNYALMLAAPGAGGTTIGFEAEGESGLDLRGSVPRQPRNATAAMQGGGSSDLARGERR